MRTDMFPYTAYLRHATNIIIFVMYTKSKNVDIRHDHES